MAELIRYAYTIEKVNDHWVALSAVFGFAGSGSSVDEAVDALELSVVAYLRAMKRRGLLGEALQQKGVTSEAITVAPDELMAIIG